jgi:phenylalanyl-tRNA synthetase alpha chain
MINISRCGRPNYDATHTPTFHQFEGLVIDEGINLTHLKGIFDYFAKNFFGPERKIRLRPFHFQFTEPSIEVDINCPLCLGKGCKVCKSGWHELGGSGMVHPQVLRNGGIDPKKYSGYAFGWGVERTYLMKSGLNLDDVRLLYEPDLRFINQF